MENNKIKKSKPLNRTTPWTVHLEAKLLDYIIENGKIEVPTAQLYYMKLRKALKINSDWFTIKDKIDDFRQTFENAKQWLVSEGIPFDNAMTNEDVREEILKICPHFVKISKIFHVEEDCLQINVVDGDAISLFASPIVFKKKKFAVECLTPCDQMMDLTPQKQSSFLNVSTTCITNNEVNHHSLSLSSTKSSDENLDPFKKHDLNYSYRIEKLKLRKRKILFEEANMKSSLEAEKRKCDLKEKELRLGKLIAEKQFKLSKRELKLKERITKYELNLKYAKKD